LLKNWEARDGSYTRKGQPIILSVFALKKKHYYFCVLINKKTADFQRKKSTQKSEKSKNKHFLWVLGKRL